MAWTVYLALSQVNYSLLAIAAAVLTFGRWRLYWIGTAFWFLVQAADEIYFGNSIINGRWEYIAVPVYALLVYLIVKRHVPHDHAAEERGELAGR